jgi:hypothetical protein
MLEQVQAWWQNATPETQALVREISLLLGALLGGQVLGGIVARTLRRRDFDSVLRVPGATPLGPDAGRGFTPSFLAGLLVRLTVWAAAAAWFARQHDRPELATTLGFIINRTWAFAGILVAALALGSLLARRVIECLQIGQRAGPETASRNGAAASHRGTAGAIGAGVYGLVVLVALLVTADMFDWPLTRNSAQALWDFAQHLLVAAGALLIGGLGARWARELATPDATATPEQRAGQFTALGIVAATTILAVAVLLSSAGLLLGLGVVAVLAVLLWLVRGSIPDVVAGLQLRGQRVREVWYEGEPWQVAQVGLLTTEITRAGEFYRWQNRAVLEARMHAAPAEANAR